MDVQTEESDPAIIDVDILRADPAEGVAIEENVAELVQKAPTPVLQVEILAMLHVCFYMCVVCSCATFYLCIGAA